MRNKNSKAKKGFTLIELMIVVAIIGVLAAIAVPRFAQMLEKSREGATKGNLAALRSSISIYYSEKEGTWPNDLTTAFSSYMYPIPPAKATPLGNSNGVNYTNTITNPDDIPAGGTGWALLLTAGPFQGNIFCNSSSDDTKGVSFTTY